MAKKGHSFNVLLTSEEYAILSELAKRANCTKGHHIRALIHRDQAMTLNNLPTCVTGQRCFVPQMHVVHAGAQPPPIAP